MTGSFSGTWNHFDTVGPKTNNHVEGYNLGLKKEDDHEKSPNIYKAEDIPQRLNAQQIENIIFNIDLLKIFT